MAQVLAGLILSALVAAPATGDDCDRQLASCRQQLVAGYHLRAQLCLDDYLAQCPTHDQLDQAADLRAAAAVLGDRSPVRRGHSPTPVSARRSGVPDSPLASLLEAGGPTQALEIVLLGGVPEFLLSSSLVAAGQGAVLTSIGLTQNRTSTGPSQNLLLSVPVLAAAGGLAAASAAAWWLRPDAGQLASFSSALWLGSVEGGLLFLALRGLDDDHRALPLQLLSWTAASALGAIAGAGLATAFELEPGDVGVMNSAALWGGVLPLFVAWPGEGTQGGTRQLLSVVVGSTLAYSAAFVAAPWIEVERPATWLIDLGGALGLFAGVAITPGGLDQPLQSAAMRGGFTLAGLVLGTGACWLAQRVIRDEPAALAVLSRWQLQPWLETSLDARTRATLGGLRLVARF